MRTHHSVYHGETKVIQFCAFKNSVVREVMRKIKSEKKKNYSIQNKATYIQKGITNDE
jgi:hypothetical protein